MVESRDLNMRDVPHVAGGPNVSLAAAAGDQREAKTLLLKKKIRWEETVV